MPSTRPTRSARCWRTPSGRPAARLRGAPDGRPRAGAGVVGVAAELAPRPALAEQVPALVELDLQVRQPRASGLVEPLARRLAFQLVLLGHQLADPPEQRVVGHVTSFR